MQNDDSNNNVSPSPEKVTFTAEMLKKHFDRARQRKYSLPRVFAFLEENIFPGYYVTPNFDINDYVDFSRDFDALLDSGINNTVKNIIIEKYGLFNDKPLSYSEISYRKNCSINKIYSVINNSIIKIRKNTFYIDRVKSYCNLKSKIIDKQEKQKNIDYILSIAKKLEEGENND